MGRYNKPLIIGSYSIAAVLTIVIIAITIVAMVIPDVGIINVNYSAAARLMRNVNWIVYPGTQFRTSTGNEKTDEQRYWKIKNWQDWCNCKKLWISKKKEKEVM